MKKHIFILLVLLFFVLTNSAFSQFVPTSGPNGGIVHAFFSDINNDIYAGTENGGVYRTTDNGDSWVPENNGLTNLDIRCFTNIDNKIFCSTLSGGIFFTTNRGDQWDPLISDLPNIYFKSIYAKDRNTLLAGSGWPGGAYISTNRGANWSPFVVDTFDNIISSFYFFENYFYASTPTHGFYRTDNVFGTWTRISYPSMWASYAFYSVGLTLYVCTGNGVKYSFDKGDTWNAGQVTVVTNGIAKVNNYMISAGALGINYSSDGGITWNPSDPNYLEGDYINAVTQNRDFVFAGDNALVWRRPVSEFVIGINPVNNSVPVSYSLNQNYPNPFNPATNIKFSVPKTSFTVVKIFNSLGEEVCVLVNQNLQAGNYEIKWDASNMPSGVYFYKISANDFNQTKKMILIK